MAILTVEGLVKSYSRRRVVDGVSLEVNQGEIVGLLGPNGAGKTTSFKMICGLVKPDKGNVSLKGVDVTDWPMYRRAREGGMGYLPQQSSVFGKLSTQDNILGMMQLLGFGRKERKARCEELLEQFKITHIRKSKAMTLSGGERRRLEIARCLVANPEIIMLDEPFAGIDPVTVQSIQLVIKGLTESGIAVLITDHAAREILQLTDRTYVVSEGRILCSGTTEQIVTHDEVRKKYLGDIEIPTTTKRSAAAQVTPEQTAPEKVTPVPAHVSPEQITPEQIAPVQSPARDVIPINPAQPTNEPAPQELRRDRPKIVFSKPRRPARKVAAPFKPTDLD